MVVLAQEIQQQSSEEPSGGTSNFLYLPLISSENSNSQAENSQQNSYNTDSTTDSTVDSQTGEVAGCVPTEACNSQLFLPLIANSSDAANANTGSEVAPSAGVQAPSVSAGVDQIITLGDVAFLRPTVTDDGLPAGLADLKTTWSQVSGPAQATFDNDEELITVARFSATGNYTLRLTVTDGAQSTQDDVIITVNATPVATLRVPQDYTSIQAAINAAPARALILVSPGVYYETLRIAKTVTLASTFYTTGDKSKIYQTVIHGSSTATETIRVTSGGGIETQLIGFRVTGGKDGIVISGQAKVMHNYFHDAVTDGVEYASGASGFVEWNVMEGGGDDGMDLNNSEVLIQHNTMRNNEGDAIEMRINNHANQLWNVIVRDNNLSGNIQDGIQIIDEDTTVATAERIIIDRNLIANNVQAGIGLMDNAVTSEDYRAANLLERIFVTNNTIVGNNHGLSGGDNLIGVNNIFANQINTAVKRVDGASKLYHSIFWNNGLDNDDSILDAATTLYANPQLDGDYFPVSGSPAIDAGTASLTLSNGETIVTSGSIAGSAPDLGRVETGLSTNNRPPTANAGADQLIVLPNPATLNGIVSDDGNPNPPGTLTSFWVQIGGPDGVVFAQPMSSSTTATFPTAGTYQLRLITTDSQLTASDKVQVTVNNAGVPNVAEMQIATGNDDAEESASGVMSLDSGDIELVNDGNNQVVGLRFNNVSVPKNASIVSAYLQFQADETQSETTSLTIQADAVDSAPEFTLGSANISSRAKTNASVVWSPAAWTAVGEVGSNQRSTNIAPVIQEIVNRAGWSVGNSMVIIISGTGHRTAESYEGSKSGAARLHIEYSLGNTATPTNTPVTPVSTSTATPTHTPTQTPTPTNTPPSASTSTPTPTQTASHTPTQTPTPASTATSTSTATATSTPGGNATVVVEVRINASSDDAEQRATGGVDLVSADIELVQDTSTQTVGLRFNTVNIPRDALITNAYIQFKTDEIQTAATSLTIQGQAADNPSTFLSIKNDVSSRLRTSAAVNWAPAPWQVVNEIGVEQRTPNLATILQEVVNRAGWNAGNSVAFIITGTGRRTADAYDSDQLGAPMLHVEYATSGAPVNTPTATSTSTATPTPTLTPTQTATPSGNATLSVEVRVNASSDDAEESETGSLSLASTDLELIYDGRNQLVGLRFNSVALPRGATIVNAYLQFQSDEAQSEVTLLSIQGEAADNPATFSTSARIAARVRTSATVSWSPPPWTSAGQAGLDQRTTNIASVVQEIVNRPGWNSGNSIVLIISGSGHRTAEAYEGSAAAAPLLHIDYSN